MIWKKRDSSSRSNRQAENPLRCSFCDKPQNEVRKLIAGPAAFICDECVAICVEIVASDGRPDAETLRRALPENKTSCGVCGKPTSLADGLPIERGGVLCGECADSVEDALARGEPNSNGSSSSF